MTSLIIVAAMGFSFLSIGIFWMGVNQLLQALVALLFLGLGFLGTQRLKTPTGATSAIWVGVSPMGALLVMFRDSAGSHAIPVAIVVSWLISSAAGAALAKRRSDP